MILAFLSGGRFFSRDVQSKRWASRGLGLARLAALVAIGLVPVSCAKDPTEVLVTVYSDVPCDAPAAVAAGPVGELGDRPASAVSTVCDPETGARGALVLVPRSDDSGELAVEVRIRTDQSQPDDCVAANGYRGCIVSRRILSYIAGRTVRMRIDLRNPCLDTPCSQTTTCVAQGLSKACVTAVIDPNECDGECTDEDLVKQSGSMLDVCGAGSNPCADPDTCAATGDGATCACPSGFTNPKGDAVQCVDVDECAASVSPCDAHAACKNSAGSYSCTCTGTYEGDGRTCAPTECDAACGENASCHSAGERFECQCDAGFGGDGQTCTDIDECATENHDCASVATCQNTPGSYTCSCPSGYTGDGTKCVDVDECESDTLSGCAQVATCTNSAGSYECACPTGYAGDGKTCTDVDECAAATPACGTGATCRNTVGSFDCACPPNFAGDPKVACTCDTSVNYSLTAATSASSTYSGYDVKHINDGSKSTVQTESQSWCNDWNKPGLSFPQWVQLDYPAERTVGRVEVYGSDGFAITTYDILAWDAATSTWLSMKSVTGNSAVHGTVSFTPIVTSKLRLLAKFGSSTQSTYARVNELESYCQ